MEILKTYGLAGLVMFVEAVVIVFLWRHGIKKSDEKAEIIAGLHDIIFKINDEAVKSMIELNKEMTESQYENRKTLDKLITVITGKME